MKKVLIAVAISFAPFIAFAGSTLTPASQCSFPPDHKVMAEDGKTIAGCITAAAWDAAMAAQQHGVDLPVFKYPATVTDKYGITYECEAFLVHGCVDATKTPEYDQYITALGTELRLKGFHKGDFGGRFDGLLAR